MAQRVKVKVRPRQTLAFPPACVHCGEPGTDRMSLRQRRGRVTRQIDVPLCVECRATLNRLSGEEERWHRLGWAATGVTLLITTSLLFVVLPTALPTIARVLLALLGAGFLARVVFSLFRRASARRALPRKQAVLAAARLADFSWRATTFEFENEKFARRFQALNEPRLMDAAAQERPGFSITRAFRQAVKRA